MNISRKKKKIFSINKDIYEKIKNKENNKYDEIDCAMFT